MLRRNAKQKPEKKHQGEKKSLDIRKKRSMVDLRRQPAVKVKNKRSTDKKPDIKLEEKTSPEQKARILIEREVKTLQAVESKKFMIMWSSIGFIMILLITVWIYQFKSIVKSSIPPDKTGSASSSFDMLEESLTEMKDNLSALEKVKDEISDFKAAIDSSASSSPAMSSSTPEISSDSASSSRLQEDSKKLMDEFEMKIRDMNPGTETSTLQAVTSTPVL